MKLIIILCILCCLVGYMLRCATEIKTGVKLKVIEFSSSITDARVIIKIKGNKASAEVYRNNKLETVFYDQDIEDAK